MHRRPSAWTQQPFKADAHATSTGGFLVTAPGATWEWRCKMRAGSSSQTRHDAKTFKELVAAAPKHSEGSLWNEDYISANSAEWSGNNSVPTASDEARV